MPKLTDAFLFNLTPETPSGADLERIKKLFSANVVFTIDAAPQKTNVDIHTWARRWYDKWYELSDGDEYVQVMFIISNKTDPLALARLVADIKELREAFSSQGEFISAAVFLRRKNDNAWHYVYV